MQALLRAPPSFATTSGPGPLVEPSPILACLLCLRLLSYPLLSSHRSAIRPSSLNQAAYRVCTSPLATFFPSTPCRCPYAGDGRMYDIHEAIVKRRARRTFARSLSQWDAFRAVGYRYPPLPFISSSTIHFPGSRHGPHTVPTLRRFGNEALTLPGIHRSTSRVRPSVPRPPLSPSPHPAIRLCRSTFALLYGLATPS
ncbi:hypothetical protein K523DRAFT_56793 [Schizophyllum commune Tattone D]|nr:hypothetical protein K523DRAFT_56793 [Schizophyllum commune Tattone D]